MRSNFLDSDRPTSETAAPETTNSQAAAPEAVTGAVDGAVAQGKQWFKTIDMNQLVGQLPQSVRNLGTQVAGRVRGFTPTQQAVGGAVLALGIGLLAVRRRRNARTADAQASGKYRAKFESKPFKGRGKAKYASSY